MPSLYLKNSNCEKHNFINHSKRKKKQGWHYIPVKKLSTLLRGITLNL